MALKHRLFSVISEQLLEDFQNFVMITRWMHQKEYESILRMM
jgi:hypothetical protein